MHLELVRERAKTFPEIAMPDRYTSAKVWHCAYASLEPLSALRRLRTVEIANYPDATLDWLGGLADLEELRILHLPHVNDLAPLADLTKLRVLHLETLPSWDSSGKVTTVTSLAPLAELPRLEEVALLGVRPANKSVEDLIRSTSLRRARLHKFPKHEVLRLEAALAEREQS